MVKDTRTPEEKQAHQDLLQAGLGFYNISSIGDTSQVQQQASMFENYAASQGLDSERDLNGLPRHLNLFGELIPKEQESSKQKLLELTTKNFDYALGGLNGETAVGLAARLGTSKEELVLEKTLSQNEEIENIKKAFSDIYEPSSLIHNYISLNTSKEEVSRAAYGALQRASQRRQSEFIYLTKDKKVAYEGRKAKTYIADNIEIADKKVAEEVRIGIGSNLASIVIRKENEKAAAKAKKEQSKN